MTTCTQCVLNKLVYLSRWIKIALSSSNHISKKKNDDKLILITANQSGSYLQSWAIYIVCIIKKPVLGHYNPANINLFKVAIPETTEKGVKYVQS